MIHEIAHKLDTLNGSANGFPPLHHSMVIKDWSESLSSAYEKLINRIEHHHSNCINAYAATNPAEFLQLLVNISFVRQKFYKCIFQIFTNSCHFITDKIPCHVDGHHKKTNFKSL